MGLIFVVVCESRLIPLRPIRGRAKMFAAVGYSIRWAKTVAPRSRRPQGQGEHGISAGFQVRITKLIVLRLLRLAIAVVLTERADCQAWAARSK
jgi:hypothetical protein